MGQTLNPGLIWWNKKEIVKFLWFKQFITHFTSLKTNQKLLPHTFNDGDDDDYNIFHEIFGKLKLNPNDVFHDVCVVLFEYLCWDFEKDILCHDNTSQRWRVKSECQSFLGWSCTTYSHTKYFLCYSVSQSADYHCILKISQKKFETICWSPATNKKLIDQQ